MRKRVASRLTEVILPSAQPWWRTSECWVYCSLVSTRKDRDLLETVQKRTTNMVEGLVHLSYKEGLRELGLFSLDKGRLKGTLSMCINTWWKGTKKSYLDSHVYWQDKRQWAQIGTQVFPYELKKILFFFLTVKWSSTGAGCLGGCGVSVLGDDQSSGKPSLTDSAWADGLD